MRGTFFMLTQEQFEKYLIGALNRDVDSERAIYEGSVDYVYNIVLKYVSDRDDAADVAQETMIQAFEKLKNYNPSKGKFKSWLAKIAINKSLKWLGKNKQMISQESAEKFFEVLETSEPTELLSERLKSVLNEGERELFELYFDLEFSHADIANALGISVSNSRVRIHRILTYLRSLPS